MLYITQFQTACHACNCLGQHRQLVGVETSHLENITVGTDDFKLDDSQRKRTKHSEDPPTASTVYVIAKEPLQGAPNRSGQRKDEPVCPVIARKGRNASANPSAPISMPPAFTGFHHGQAIQNGDSLIGALVTGHVDSKIDCGYFITIFINGYSFQGRFSCQLHNQLC